MVVAVARIVRVGQRRQLPHSSRACCRIATRRLVARAGRVSALPPGRADERGDQSQGEDGEDDISQHGIGGRLPCGRNVAADGQNLKRTVTPGCSSQTPLNAVMLKAGTIATFGVAEMTASMPTCGACRNVQDLGLARVEDGRRRKRQRQHELGARQRVSGARESAPAQRRYPTLTRPLAGAW